MSGSFNRMPLAAILGLVIGRLACADTVDMLPAGRIAVSDVDAAFSQFSRLPQYEPPLQLALALNRERQHLAPQLSADTQKPAALELTAEIRPLPPAAISLAALDADTASSQISRLPQYDPPLRLALALSRERRHATPVSESAQKPAAVQLTAQTRPLHSAAFAQLQQADAKLAEQAKSEDVLPQKTTETPMETEKADPARTWEITPGDRTLNTTLSKWSANAGWQLVWDLEVDYPIETRAVLEGTFEEAVAAVAQSLAGASVPVQATFYAGNRVLRIVAKGSK